MKTLRSVPFLVVGLLVVSACPGGVESRVCKQYFEVSEQCAAKAEPARAQALRDLAKLARDGLTKLADKPAVEESCKEMLATLRSDPACK
jgi:hypothetical protein